MGRIRTVTDRRLKKSALRCPWEEHRMTSRVKAVVEAFENLTPDEQIAAYLEIEKIWKDQQNHGVESNSPTDESLE
jgi:hypothetical protein